MWLLDVYRPPYATLSFDFRWRGDQLRLRDLAALDMLTREGARLQVFLELRRRFGLRRGGEELVIVDERIIERPWGWVVPWTTRGWLAGELRDIIGGNGPCLINRHDGSVTFCPSGVPVEECIARYEEELRNIPGDDDEQT